MGLDNQYIAFLGVRWRLHCMELPHLVEKVTSDHFIFKKIISLWGAVIRFLYLLLSFSGGTGD